MKRYQFNDPNDPDAGITTSFGKWLEKIYAVSKNSKVRILHPIGFLLYLFTFTLIAIIDRVDFETNPNTTTWKSIKSSYKYCKELYEVF